MSPRRIAFAFLVASIACMGSFVAGHAFAQPTQAEIHLLEPIGGSASIPVSPGAGTAIAYFNTAANWLLIVAVGSCVVWVVIGGIEIMISGGGEWRGRGKENIRWAITGIVMLLFAGFILRTLNSMFFQ